MIGAGCLAGVGFTMALFIGGLAFGEELRNIAKLGILVASSFSAIVGLVVLGVRRRPVSARSDVRFVARGAGSPGGC